MPTPVKICGLSTPESVRAAIDGGAGYVGFMFFDKVPRRTPGAAARLASRRGRAASRYGRHRRSFRRLAEELRETLQPNAFRSLHGESVPRLGAAIKATRAVNVLSVSTRPTSKRRAYDPSPSI